MAVVLALLFVLVGCASTRNVLQNVPAPVSAYESEQWLAAHAACGYASPCADPDAAQSAVLAVRNGWRARVVDVQVDARVDAWIVSERARQ